MVSDMVVAYKPHRVSTDEFHRMAAAGVFEPDARIELIDGEIVERVSPIHPPHASTTNKLVVLFARALGDKASVHCQSPLTLPTDSEPQPDVMIAKPGAMQYDLRHPTSRDVLLVVEVADITFGADRRRKIPLYARAGVPEAWLVDLVRSLVYVYSEPREGEFTNVRVAHRGETIAPTAFPGVNAAVDAFLPIPTP